MSLHITLDDAEINAALNNLVRQLNALQPAMDDIGEALVGLIHEQLIRGNTPWGDPFAPLTAAYTQAVPRRAGGIPLNDTHQHLFNRLNSHAGHDFVSVGILDNPNTPGLALAHQFGSDRNGLPARPYLPLRNHQVDLPQDWATEVLAIIAQHVDLMR